MKDPKGTDKYYYNVYIHNNGPDLFPNDWAQGQDTDNDGYPFLTIPVKLTSPDYHGHVHEGFHIFQYNANSPGLTYKGDSQWFIEATANWYVNITYPNDLDGFICGQAVTAISQVPMWYSFENKKPGDKNSWLRDDHQYGMNIYLYYLTEVCKVSRYAIAHSFYDNVTLLPQEYLYSILGGSDMRKYFADGPFIMQWDSTTSHQHRLRDLKRNLNSTGIRMMIIVLSQHIVIKGLTEHGSEYRKLKHRAAGLIMYMRLITPFRVII